MKKKIEHSIYVYIFVQYLNNIIQKHSIDYDCTEFELIPIEKQFTATIPGL